MIEASGLSKRYGTTLAVDDLSFTVPPGQVTGFLGPNGAGKSTTMRLILGLDAPSSGSVTVSGRPYAALRRPLFEVGAMLEAKAFHGGRNARNHLLCLALSNGISPARVEQVLDLVGLRNAARKRAGGFSLGMGQRLGIAAALLGDPPVLMLDEPVNGLDPEGVVWIRNLMSEMSLTADRLIVIGRGRLIAQTTIKDFLAGGPGNFVQVRSPQASALAALLEARGVTVARQPGSALRITGAPSDAVGELARVNGLTLQELSEHETSLEDRYMELTSDSVDYRTAEGAPVPVPNPN